MYLSLAAESQTSLALTNGLHAEYAANLRYFIKEGMAENDGCEYVIVVQHVSTIPHHHYHHSIAQSQTALTYGLHAAPYLILSQRLTGQLDVHWLNWMLQAVALVLAVYVQ